MARDNGRNLPRNFWWNILTGTHSPIQKKQEVKKMTEEKRAKCRKLISIDLNKIREVINMKEKRAKCGACGASLFKVVLAEKQVEVRCWKKGCPFVLMKMPRIFST